ncbi:MAG: internal scaffolding protein [Microvirus sp.]|nr:MAG: internal scaffolding protein [Microvirus sp.]
MSSNSKFPRILFESTNHLKSNYSLKPKYSIKTQPNSPYTKQEFKNECDINILMARYQVTGELTNLNERAPQYLDATGFDYQTSMEFIAGAKSLFHELPSDLRFRFGNDPAAFLDFTSKDSNREEMAALGLLKPKQEWASMDAIPKPSEPTILSHIKPQPDEPKTPVA